MSTTKEAKQMAHTAAGWKRTATRLAANYGMALVLVLLCAYLSVATMSTQQLTGDAAADDVIARVPAGANVLVVGHGGAEDQSFIDRVASGVEAKQAHVIGRSNAAPSDARAALEEAANAGKSIDVIATTPAAATWPVFENLATRFPAHAKAKVISPSGGRWPTFLKRDNLVNVANQVVVIALLAIGMTLVIITGGIDLSVGSLVALSAVVVALCIRHFGGAAAGFGAMLGGSLIAILACTAAGALSGVLVTAFRLPPFIATLGGMLIASGAAYQMTHNLSVYEIPDSFTTLGRGFAFGRLPNAVLLMLVLYVITHLVMSMTTFGRYVYAVGGNAEAARLSGVRVNRILIIVYAISGATAGLGGVMVTSQLKAGSPTYGLGYELYAIAAVVVGGTSLLGGSGRIFNTLIGAFIIAVIQNGMNLKDIESNAQKMVLGAVIVISVIVDSLTRDGAFTNAFGWVRSRVAGGKVEAPAVSG